MSRAFEVELELLDVTPRVWRRLRVPAALRLADLHHVIQVVMAWEDRHLHEFDVDGRAYGLPPDEDDEIEPWDGEDDAAITISEAMAAGEGRIGYVYDFGDEWRMSVAKVTDVVIPGRVKVECLDGEGAAPPEDLGGSLAYQDVLDAWVKGGRRALSKELRDWLPRDFVPGHLDLSQVNRRLRAAAGDEEPAEAPPHEFADDEEQLLAEVTLLALFLGSWEEKSGFRTAWKTVRFEILDVLTRAGLIDTTPARKSLILTELGVKRAESLRARATALLVDGSAAVKKGS